ncbi:uncharacterized protein DUF4102 [Erwinia sp. AG740]|nr:uncharacterized protein DUF4102 [Erwinia sp. AG740]
MLTDTKLRNLKPKDKLYKVNDRDGLYVAVTTAGSISFRYNYSNFWTISLAPTIFLKNLVLQELVFSYSRMHYPIAANSHL